MKAAPAFQFYPSDWLREPALRACSLESRGLWIDMMCIMHEAEIYGHLVIGKKQINTALLSRMVGFPEEKIKPLIEELESVGVFSRTKDQTIFSRRMVRDEELRQKRKQAGEKGGKTSHDEERSSQANGEQIPKQTGSKSQANGKQKNGICSEPLPPPSSSPSSSSSFSSSPTSSISPSGDILEAAVQIWNEMAERTGLKKVIKLTEPRKKSLRLRLREHDGLNSFRQACENIEHNSWLLGENESGWKANFDFLIRPSKFVKVLEDAYEQNPDGGNKQLRIEKQNQAAGDEWLRQHGEDV